MISVDKTLVDFPVAMETTMAWAKDSTRNKQAKIKPKKKKK